MAEIRKFDPAVGNSIAQALQKAMGEPVRPNPPGQARTSSKIDQPGPPQTSVLNLTVTTKTVTEVEAD